MAAGKGKRLGGVTPKPLVVIVDGKNIISKIIETVSSLQPKHLVVVVGHKRSIVTKKIKDSFQGKNVTFAYQRNLNGTLGAAEAGIDVLLDKIPRLLILPADNGWFLKSKTLCSLIKKHIERQAVVSILLSHEFNNNLHKVEYIVSKGRLSRVQLREKKFSSAQTSLAGTGILCVEKKYLDDNKHLIKSNPNGEQNVSRIIEVALSQNKIVSYTVARKDEILTINTKQDLRRVRAIAKKTKHQRPRIQ